MMGTTNLEKVNRQVTQCNVVITKLSATTVEATQKKGADKSCQTTKQIIAVELCSVIAIPNTKSQNSGLFC